MAFAPRNLSVLSYTNGFTLWHYTTPDNWPKIAEPNYFNPAADMLRKGDLIVTNCDTGGTQVNKFIWVASVSGGVVQISNA